MCDAVDLATHSRYDLWLRARVAVAPIGLDIGLGLLIIVSYTCVRVKPFSRISCEQPSCHVSCDLVVVRSV